MVTLLAIGDELSLKVVGGWMELKVEFEWRPALQVEDRA